MATARLFFVSRLYSFHLFTGTFDTSSMGYGIPIGNVGGIQVVWKQVSFDVTGASITGEQCWILKNATYDITRSFILPDMAGAGHQNQTDLRFTFNNPDDDEYNVYVSGGVWDIQIDGFLLGA